MTEHDLIVVLTRDFHLCYPCEMFDGYFDASGNLSPARRCIEGMNPCKCGIACDFAKHLIRHVLPILPHDE